MNTKLLLFIAIFFISINLKAQNVKLSYDYLKELPKDLVLDKNIQQKYKITTEYFDYDLYSNLLGKTLITGDYTCWLDTGNVKWNNVEISKWDFIENSYKTPEKQEIMENFEYFPSEKMLDPSAFSNFPPYSTYLQNLVWDMISFEVFAWEYFDKLELNKEFIAESANIEVELAGTGTFENKEIVIFWRGISFVNDEYCALFEFTAMNNKLKVKNDYIEIKGRSHYWGNVYVSLSDKQIEYANMHEDVLMELTFAGNPTPKNINTTRNIVLEKIIK